ncbi:MAG: DMT family transporter, partial [Bacteroidota bacterium]
MKSLLLYLLAFTGGVLLAVQAGFNTQLGTLLKQPILAVVSMSIASAFFGLAFLLILNKGSIPWPTFHQVPWYLWFIGGLFSMMGVSLYFYIIPKLGISKMIALGLSGQLIFSLIAGSFGWLNLSVEPLTTKRMIGIGA